MLPLCRWSCSLVQEILIQRNAKVAGDGAQVVIGDGLANQTAAHSEIATVTSDGKIICQHIGTTTLSVTIGGLCQSTELIVDGIPIESLQIILPTHRLDVGTTIVPSVQLVPNDANYYSDIDFYSSDDSILHKNAEGSFIAASTGVVKLYAKTCSEQLIGTYQTIYVTSHNSI